MPAFFARSRRRVRLIVGRVHPQATSAAALIFPTMRRWKLNCCVRYCHKSVPSFQNVLAALDNVSRCGQMLTDRFMIVA